MLPATMGGTWSAKEESGAKFAGEEFDEEVVERKFEIKEDLPIVSATPVNTLADEDD